MLSNTPIIECQEIKSLDSNLLLCDDIEPIITEIQKIESINSYTYSYIFFGIVVVVLLSYIYMASNNNNFDDFNIPESILQDSIALENSKYTDLNIAIENSIIDTCALDRRGLEDLDIMSEQSSISSNKSWSSLPELIPLSPESSNSSLYISPDSPDLNVEQIKLTTESLVEQIPITTEFTKELIEVIISNFPPI